MERDEDVLVELAFREHPLEEGDLQVLREGSQRLAGERRDVRQERLEAQLDERRGRRHPDARASLADRRSERPRVHDPSEGRNDDERDRARYSIILLSIMRTTISRVVAALGV